MRAVLLLAACGLIVLGSATPSRAQAPPPGPTCCAAHARQAAGHPGPFSGRGLFGVRPAGPRGVPDPYGRPMLPRGQVYYGGRYFGSFNNRFYGPQYGYF